MTKPSVEPTKTGTPASLFFTMGLDMSWRLALSVLVPVIGGAELDKYFKTSPALLIVGLVLALALSIVTIRRTMKLANGHPFIVEYSKKPKPQPGDDDDD